MRLTRQVLHRDHGVLCIAPIALEIADDGVSHLPAVHGGADGVDHARDIPAGNASRVWLAPPVAEPSAAGRCPPGSRLPASWGQPARRARSRSSAATRASSDSSLEP